jgi:phosphatidylglycerophosphate synthase
MRSTAELRPVVHAGKHSDPAWYLVHRRVSIHLTRLALALGLQANHASFGMMIAGALGAFLIASAQPGWNVLGFAFFYLAFLLDKVDGEIARWRGTSNANGILLDRLFHRLVEPTLFVAVAVHELRLGAGPLVLVWGFATALLANAIEEIQHLPAYVLVKRVREGGELPTVPPRRSAALAVLGRVLRPLKLFRMPITALQLYAVLYAVEWAAHVSAPTFGLVFGTIALAVYLVFQCIDYFLERLDAESFAIAAVLRKEIAMNAWSTREDRTSTTPTTQEAKHRKRAVVVAHVACAHAGAGAGDTFGADVWVSSAAGCSPGGPGTPASPYCTITSALNANQLPGTTIRVLPGIYRESVSVPANGTSGSPIVIRGEGDAQHPVVIEGADDFSDDGLWAQFSGDVWLAASASSNVSRVEWDGTRLDSSTVATAALPPNSYQWVAGQGLYVNAGGGNPAAGHVVLASVRSFGFLLSNRSWITVQGFAIVRSGMRGVQLNTPQNVVVRDNTIEKSSRHGVEVNTGTAVQILSNVVSNCGNHGISIQNGTTGSTIDGNECFSNARPDVRAANGINLLGSTGNTISRNRTHDNQDTGLQFQTGASNNVCQSNVSWNNGDHGFDHIGATGNAHVGDVAYGNFKDGFSIEGNATFHKLYDCIAIDNGLTTGRFDLFVDSSSTAGFESNDNLFWKSTGGDVVRFFKTNYTLVSNYSGATGHDTRTIQANPLFQGPASGDFHLTAGSPAIDNGNSSVPFWPPTDAAGLGRFDDPTKPNTGIGPVTYADRGAYEYPASLVAADPVEGSIEQPTRVHPNPLRLAGRISYSVARPGPVRLTVFDTAGRRVRGLDTEAAVAGAQVAAFDGRGDDGVPLRSGVYFYRVASAGGVEEGRFVVAR